MHLPAIALALSALQGSGNPSAATARTYPHFRCRFVAEEDGRPLAGVRVESAKEWTGPFTATTGPDGWLDLATRSEEGEAFGFPRGSSAYPRRLAEVTAEFPGCARTVVNADSQAPWASPVPMRASAVLAGTVRGAVPGEDVSITCAPSATTWPPQSGLFRLPPRVRSPIDAEGRFEISGVPSRTPLTVWVGAGTYAGGICIETDLVLQPGERRDRTFTRPTVAPAEPRPAAAFEMWFRVDAIALEADGRVRPAGFEMLPDGRDLVHAIAGGRWHAHGNGPCAEIETRAGNQTLVARTFDGWCGARALRIPGDHGTQRVIVGPGGLLRIDVPVEGAMRRLRIVAGGLPFAERALLPGILLHEVVPAGEVRLECAPGGPTRVVQVVAGAILRVQL